MGQMDRWRLNILGRFELCGPDGQEVALRARKSVALLALLGAAPQQRLSRDRLALLLWEDMPDAQARGNLRQLLATTRRLAPFLDADDPTIGFAPNSSQIDFTDFQAALADGSPAALGLAAKLYRGDLLDGLSLRCCDFEAWLLAERERLREQAVQLFLRLMEHATASGAEPAIRWAMRVLTVDPLHEPAHRALMQFYASQGRHASALRQYEQLRETLARELDAQPEKQTDALARRIREGRTGLSRSTGPRVEFGGRDEGAAVRKPARPPVIPSTAARPFNNPSGDAEDDHLSEGTTDENMREDAVGKMALEVGDRGTPGLKHIAGNARVPPVPLGTAVRPALPLPDKPSIAVLAFTNMSGDPEQEYFSDGIADDIITELSRIPWLLVIARNSSFAYKGNAIDLKQIGYGLGVRYVMEGSVRRSGERVRVNAQLIDAETGTHVWAERYDRELTDVFIVQDEITFAVTKAIGPALAGAEQRRALRKPPSNLGAWECYQRGMWHHSRFRSEDDPRAHELFNRALELDPTLAAAHTGLAAQFIREGTVFASRPLLEALRLAGDEAQKALELDPTDGDAHALRAEATGSLGDYAGGFAHVERALLINPNCALAYHVKGWLLIFAGRPAEGREAMLFGVRLDPRRASYPHVRSHIVMSYYLECDYERTVTEATRLIVDRPDHPYAYRWLAAALGQLGRGNEARSVLNKAIETAPGSFRLYVEQRVPWMGQAVYAHMLEGLRKAGWQPPPAPPAAT
jgi:adenylate cyclase